MNMLHKSRCVLSIIYACYSMYKDIYRNAYASKGTGTLVMYPSKYTYANTFAFQEANTLVMYPAKYTYVHPPIHQSIK